MQDTTFNVPYDAETIENMNKPALPVGNYLAVVTGLDIKDNDVKKSRGLNFSLLINSNPDAVKEGWDSEARPVSMPYYVYLGKYDNNGVLLPNSFSNFRLSQIQDALNVGGRFNKSDVMHRQIVVKIIHDPSLDDQEALKADPTHVVERYFAKVNGAIPYKVNDEKAPVLANYAEANADQFKPAEPAGDEF